VSIDPQPATTPLLFQARPPARPPHRVVQVERRSRFGTLARISGLVVLTTVGVAVVATVAAGATFFAILNIR